MERWYRLALAVVTGMGLIMFAGVGTAEAAAHANGVIVRHSNGNWLMIDNGQLRWVGSEQELNSWGYTTANIVPANSDDNALPAPVNPLWPRAGTVVKACGSPNIYVIEYSGGVAQKRLVTSPQVLFDLGFNAGDVVAPPCNVNMLPGPNGADLSSAALHPDGMIINEGGNDYVIDGGIKYWVPSTEMLANLLNAPSPKRRVVPATSGDISAAFAAPGPGAMADYLPGTLIRQANGDMFFTGNGASGVENQYVSGPGSLPRTGWPYANFVQQGQFGTIITPNGPTL